jgi:hypothetical protein
VIKHETIDLIDHAFPKIHYESAFLGKDIDPFTGVILGLKAGQFFCDLQKLRKRGK